MTRINKVTKVDEIIAKWPRLLKLAATQTSITPKLLLLRFLTCFQNGAVFLVFNDHGLVGSACVEKNCTSVILHSLPSDQGDACGKSCLAVIKQWAKKEGFARMVVTSTRLSGSSYRYFEKSLGFRRHSITFQMELD